ncbi:MAG: Polyprenol monophosphomannose synthase [Dehalococcoidia bacterium]|nr:Polyprenol monophosphomannose synthase [Chloroflexota bacterium]
MTNTLDRTCELLVVIAAFNEERAIKDVVSGLRALGHDVVVVDDGSGDETSASALSAGAIVARHPINLGQGAALQTGLTYALRAGYQHVVTFDADGQHDPADIATMKQLMASTGAEFVLGSRFLGSTIGMTTARRLLLKAAVVFTRLTTGLALTDAHNGLRLLSRKALMSIDLQQNRMAHASEILDQIAASGLSFVECPVTIRYTDYSKAKGQSGFNSVNIVLDLVLQRLRK